MHDPVRDTAVAKLVSYLAQITTKNGYTYDVGPERIYMRDAIGPNCEIPTLHVVQRIEREKMRSTQRHVDCYLTVNVGFCAGADESGQPDRIASLFIADIKRAVPYTADIGVYVLEVPDTMVQDQVSFTRQGSAVNVAAPIPGRIFGQTDFVIKYSHALNNPRYI